MRLVVLMEDNYGNNECECEHGLSIYVETGRHKILVDTGASSKTLDNARKLGIDLTKVDTVFLSHGHYDHAGGILPLQAVNHTARIYMQKSALGSYYHGERYIGIDPDIQNLPNVSLLDGEFKLDEQLSVFSSITGRKLWPESNRILSVRVNGCDMQDEFSHEQCVVIHGSKDILISGCAHNGILNIMDRYQEIYSSVPDLVISGFHMIKKTDYTEDEINNIKNTAQQLNQYKTEFFTGHCSGQKAINIMKPIMGNKLHQLHCGMELILEREN